jgi:protein TonB
MRDIGEPTIPEVQFLPTEDGPGISTLIARLGPHTEISTPGPPPVPPPTLPPPPKPVDTHPIRTSSGTQAAKLIYQVKPEYPQLAKITHTQGVVVLEALIRRDGSIDSLRVISGHQLLTQSALDAVKQWKYQPTLLNGEPVEVVTTVTVTFTLQ